jgi:UDP-2,3-diacylglucosamine hydrolase
VTAGGVRDTVYFVSDAHFGLAGGDGEKVRLFCELAAEMRGRAAAAYVVGDLFDFWIEYRYAIRPDYFAVLHELRGLVEAGVDVRYLAGNHDFALGGFLTDTLGIKVHKGCVDAELQGRRIHIGHGDKIGKGRALRAVDTMLRSKPLQSLYKAIHPDIGVRFGTWCSAVSKKITGSRGISERELGKYRRAARARLKSGTCDLVIFAHTHRAELISYDEGEYCNIGSWMGSYDYAAMRGGKIQLLKWGASAS